MKSRGEINKSWYVAISRLVHRIYTSIDSASIARVVKYDKKKHVADIQPLANFADGTRSAQFLDVPVSENCYKTDELLEKLKPEFAKVDAHVGSSITSKLPKKPRMRVGSIVVYVALDRDMDNWDGTGNEFTPESNRTHDANDSIIIGTLGSDD